jgi:chromosome segregation ATPase
MGGRSQSRLEDIHDTLYAIAHRISHIEHKVDKMALDLTRISTDVHGLVAAHAALLAKFEDVSKRLTLVAQELADLKAGADTSAVQTQLDDLATEMEAELAKDTPPVV